MKENKDSKFDKISIFDANFNTSNLTSDMICAQPCPFELRKWLDFVVVIFFKNAEKIARSDYVLKKISLDFIL